MARTKKVTRFDKEWAAYREASKKLEDTPPGKASKHAMRALKRAHDDIDQARARARENANKLAFDEDRSMARRMPTPKTVDVHRKRKVSFGPVEIRFY